MDAAGLDRLTVRRWLLVVPLSLALGLIFSAWGVPASWILAGILASGASALIRGEKLPVNRGLYIFSAGVIGIMAALPLAHASLGVLGGFLLPGLAVTAATLSLGFIGGLSLARFQPEISRESGVLSMLPGAASFLTVVAEEIGADSRYVALTQYLRLLIVALSLPLVTGLLTTSGSGAEGGVPTPVNQEWWMILLVAAVAAGGNPVAKFLRLPVPAVLGPILLTLGLSAFPGDLNLHPPEYLRILAFLAVGWLCGGSLSVGSLKLFARQLPVALVFIALVIGSCALMARGIADWLGIGYRDAYLATSPGALDVVLAISSEAGTSPVVVAMQLIRVILVLLTAAALPRIIRRLPGNRRGV